MFAQFLSCWLFFSLLFQIRLILEIAWPLFLFVILVLVRLRGLRKYHHQCKWENERRLKQKKGVAHISSIFYQVSSTRRRCRPQAWPPLLKPSSVPSTIPVTRRPGRTSPRCPPPTTTPCKYFDKWSRLQLASQTTNHRSKQNLFILCFFLLLQYYSAGGRCRERPGAEFQRAEGQLAHDNLLGSLHRAKSRGKDPISDIIWPGLTR